MKTSQSFGVHFTVRADKVKDGKAPIYARITVNGQRISMALKKTVELSSWDAARGHAKGARGEIKSVNNYLEEVRLALGNCYQNLVLKGKMVSADMVKDGFLGTSEEVHSLSELFEYHNHSATSTLKWSTLKHYYVTQRYLVKFIHAQHKASDVFLHELNYKFIQDFETYLRNHKPKDHQKPLNNNGVMKHIIRLKKMVLGILDISTGGLSGTVADPKVIFGAALKAAASSIILAHNHPSGNLKPSHADIALTQKIATAGTFLDIAVLEHIILTSEGYLSFADEGLM